ncbi:hypothetical protein JCM19274_5335 [Algibacter lectus]|uniref:Uncharacterized protein n=1 Tax=Algibacter lectus TaxID=221126 RepID=A0A090X4E1_9FLAO|nr:EpsG family protein [Algibacter lectus]GAL77622.1 hypothetical protein JCM19274_5335 [Algibacter lectus]
MFDFIPIEYHYDILVYFIFFLVLANLLHAYTLDLTSDKNLKFIRTFGWLLFICMTIYLGLRPLVPYFGDMGSYAGYFRAYQSGVPVTTDKDVFFHYYMKFLSNFMSPKGFFLTTEFFYVFPMLLLSKTYFKEFWFYSLLMFLASFSFYSYGVNGIRNGLATSMFLWGTLLYK